MHLDHDQCNQRVFQKRRKGIRLKRSPPRPEFEVQTWKEVEEQEEEKINQGRQKGNCQSFDRTSPGIQMIFRFLENHDHDFSKTNLRLWEGVAISMQSHWRPHCYLCCVAKTTFNGRGIEANVGN